LMPSCIDNCVFDDKRRMPFDAHNRIAMHTYIFNNLSRRPLSHETSGLIIVTDSTPFLVMVIFRFSVEESARHKSKQHHCHINDGTITQCRKAP
jgi:hypothetical protein